MRDIEQVCRKIFSDPQFVAKFLVGGLLSFIPIVIILVPGYLYLLVLVNILVLGYPYLLVLGYLYRYGQQVRDRDDLVLPEWGDWKRLIIDGLRFLVILALFFALPVALGWLLSKMLVLFLGVLAYFPLGLALFVSPPLTVGALYQYQSRRKFEDLARLDVLFGMMKAGLSHMIIPALAYAGLLLVGAPIFGFAFFLGFIVIIAYYTSVFLHLEKEGKIAPG